MISVRHSILVLAAFLLAVQAQRISEQKCSEYRKLGVKKATIIPLTVKPKPVIFVGNDCSKTVQLIVGGEAAKPGEFPHHALLGYPDEDAPEGYRFICGGALISEKFVLTAAHCLSQLKPKIVRLGEHSLSNIWDDQVDFEIESFKKYPKYTHKLAYNDIALIELKTEVRFSSLIRPACLWAGPSFNISSVIATGFGDTEFAGELSDVLRKVQLEFVDRKVCDEAFDKQDRFPDGVLGNQLCIGSIRGGKDTCQGDSGGPVQVITDPKTCTYHVLGVTSTSVGTCAQTAAAIYTRVYSFLDWIEEVVWGVAESGIRFEDDDELDRRFFN